jgi:hypothetical protein
LSISIEVLGIEEAREFFEHASEALVESVSVKLQEVCEMVADYAQSIAPVKTGDYANSIHVEQEGPLQFRIVASDRKAAIIEFGSAPHFILPRYTQALKFDVDGETVFSKYVMHPGTPPLFILHRAKKDNMDKIVQAIRDGVREALKGG